MKPLLTFSAGSFIHCINPEERRKVSRWRMLAFATDPTYLIRLISYELHQNEAIYGKVSKRPWGKTKVWNSTLFYLTKKQAELARSRHYDSLHLCLAAPLPLDEMKDLSHARRHLQAVGTLMTAQGLIQAVRQGQHGMSEDTSSLWS